MGIKTVKAQFMSHPHARVRGIHVRNQAGTNLVARRRGEILLAAAKADHKQSIGAVAEATGEVITPRLTARLVRGVEGAKATLGRLIAVTVAGVAVLVFTWPALILGRVLYGVWVQLHSRLTPRTWIAAVAAVVALVAGWVVWTMTDHDTNGAAVKSLWWSLQPGLGLAYTAWLVHAWGWAAVVTETAVVTPMTGFVPVPDDPDDSTDDGADDADEEITEETTETAVVTPPAVGFVPVPDDPEVVAEENEETPEVPEDFVDEPPGPEPPDEVVTSAGIPLFGDDDEYDDDEYDDDMAAAFGPTTSKEKNNE